MNTERPTLFISRDTREDWITAIKFGRTDDGQPADHWRPLNCWVGWLLDEPDGRVIDLRLNDASKADLSDDAFDELWSSRGPRFDAPMLALIDAPAGAILSAALLALGDDQTVNRDFFDGAVAADDPEQALKLWTSCLQAGDPMAHYGLGYTHFALRNYRAAYTHLRHYAALAPHDSWTWCWLGRAAMAVGEMKEGKAALLTARRLEAETGVETDAKALLEKLK